MSFTPNIDAFRAQVERMQSQGSTSGPMRAHYQALDREITAQTSGMNLLRNREAISAFERNLGSNGFKRDLLSLADNPDVLRRILPQMIAQPDSMVQIVDRAAAAAAPTQRPAQQQRPAAAAQTEAPRRPAAPAADAPAAPPRRVQSQASPVAAAAEPAAPAPAETTAPEATAAPAAGGVLGKMERLEQFDGYKELLGRIENNPRLNDMFGAMLTGGGGDPAAAEETLDGILSQAEQNPRIFRDLIQTIDEKPGMVSSIAESMANDPKNGMMMIGMYSQFHQGFGKTLEGFLGAGAMDGLIQGLMGMIGKLFGGSGGFMAMGNNGGDLLAQFGRITGATAPVTTIDAATGTASDPARPGTQTQTPVQLAQQREAELRRTGQTQQPPGMAAPAPSGAS
ncbi:MAG: hypothetical protein ACXW4B_05740 [Micavibrio sp.]